MPDIPSSPPPVPVLAVVCGLPATGKTTLAKLLQEALGWPLFAKDDFKERLFDEAGHDPRTFTRTESMMIGRQALTLLFRVTQEVTEAGHSCIVEANFLPDLAQADFEPILPLADIRQIHCVIPDELVVTRYQERADAGSRHPVHTDQDAIGDLLMRVEAGDRPLPLSTPLLQVNTTDGYDPCLSQILAFLAGESYIRSPTSG